MDYAHLQAVRALQRAIHEVQVKRAQRTFRKEYLKQWAILIEQFYTVDEAYHLAERGYYECLIFTSQPSDKRPKIWFRGSNVRVYIAVYRYLWGPVPQGLNVCHHCDNSRCWEPNHLYAGLQYDNMRDRALRNPDSFSGITRNFLVGLVENR